MFDNIFNKINFVRFHIKNMYVTFTILLPVLFYIQIVLVQNYVVVVNKILLQSKYSYV
jgi:hypothetical protein